MKRMVVIPSLAILAAVGLLALAGSASAHTCASACSQIRRACIHVSKADRKIGRIECKEQAEACVDGCEANAETCPGDCDAAADACAAACAGDPVCEGDCAATQTQCHDDCANCVDNCGAAAVACGAAVKDQAAADREDCDIARASCRDVCIDPIDSACVNGCKRDQHQCRNEAGQNERVCKKECERGPGRRACVRSCRKAGNADLRLCSEREAVCIGGCIGLP